MRTAMVNDSRKQRRPGITAGALLALFMLAASSASSAAVHAQLDRDTARDGDTVTLSIEHDASQSGEPDLSPLRKDFQVLGTSASTEVNVVNGSMSRRNRWLVQLQPLHTGTLEIPSITVGQEHTAALELRVAPVSRDAAGRDAGHVFVQVEGADPGKSIYVQQQIPYTVRLYYDDTVQNGELAAPAPANAIVEQLGDEKRYAVTRLGRPFNVVERRYVIAPEKSGALEIPGVAFRGIAFTPQDRQAAADPGDDLIDRFMRGTPLANDPFFKGGFGGGALFGDAGHPIAARGPDISLPVQPRPAAASGNWLPADQITLHDSWEDHPPQLKVGEPATRTITVEAKGLSASQIPPLKLDPPGNARWYPEASDNSSRTDGEAIYGISKQSVTYIPTSQGTLAIPPVELAWWNLRTNSQSVARLPGREMAIEPGAPGSQSNTAPSPPVAAVPGQPATKAISPMQQAPDRWMWLAGGLAALVVAALSIVVLQRSRRRSSKSTPAPAASAPARQRKSARRGGIGRNRW